MKSVLTKIQMPNARVREFFIIKVSIRKAINDAQMQYSCLVRVMAKIECSGFLWYLGMSKARKIGSRDKQSNKKTNLRGF